jgi:hypothetical protein
VTADNVLFGVNWRDALDATGLALNFEADAFKMSLHTNTYTPDADAHDEYADLTNEHAATGNYTTGGNTLDTVVINLTVTTDYLTVDFADETWASSTITARQGVMYDDTLTGDKLVSCHDFGQDYSSSSGNFIVQPAATGAIRFPLAP